MDVWWDRCRNDSDLRERVPGGFSVDEQLNSLLDDVREGLLAAGLVGSGEGGGELLLLVDELLLLRWLLQFFVLLLLWLK